jgi:hypothetical protein
MGKRPSFTGLAVDQFRFLAEQCGFTGPEVQAPPDRIPAVASVRYRRADVTLEIIHVVGFMGENYVEARLRDPAAHGGSDWTVVGQHTTRTGYQLRRALGLQERAIRSHLGLR